MDPQYFVKFANDNGVDFTYLVDSTLRKYESLDLCGAVFELYPDGLDMAFYRDGWQGVYDVMFSDLMSGQICYDIVYDNDNDFLANNLASKIVKCQVMNKFGMGNGLMATVLRPEAREFFVGESFFEIRLPRKIKAEIQGIIEVGAVEYDEFEKLIS